MEAVLAHQINLAILPLQVLSGDPDVKILSEGLLMDLITDISRFRNFQILAYETSHVLNPNGRPGHLDPESLQLDYLVKGMVRSFEDKLSFNLQLIHVPENRVVWAEKFGGKREDFFRIQEDIVEKIVTSVQHFVDFDLLKELRKKPLTGLNTYECWLKGYQELKKGTLEADEQARQYFIQAMEQDPGFPRAYTGMSLSYFNEWSCQLWSRWDVCRTGAFEWAQKAIELDAWDHMSHAILGRIHLFQGQYGQAEHHLRRSLEINSNDPETLSLIASSFTFLGYKTEALDLYEKARRLNPVNELAACGAFIHFELGDFEEALSLGSRHELGKGWVDFPAFLAAACFEKGDYANMNHYWDQFLKSFSEKINGGKPADTGKALQWMMDVNPFRGETYLAGFWNFIRQNEDIPATPPQPAKVRREFHQFTREGDLWSIVYAGQQIYLQDLKGYQDLARLLSNPNHPIHCTDLMGTSYREEGEMIFDEKARSSYQKRILNLQEEIREAETAFQSDRLAILQEEYDTLLSHLSNAIGKGGKTKKMAGTTGKCRSAITWRIRSAIKKITAHHPALGRHLDVSIRTGVFCEYTPEKEMDWKV